MSRGLVVIFLSLATLVAAPAPAQVQALPLVQDSAEDAILAGLQAQGFHLVERSRTWLGRVRLIVENGSVRREIVFYPGTGEILRDYAERLAADRDAPAPVAGADPGGNLVAPPPADKPDPDLMISPPIIVADPQEGGG